LRLTAQEQAKAEKAFKVRKNFAKFVHKDNYTGKSVLCKRFLADFLAQGKSG